MVDLVYTNGAHPGGTLIQASDGKLYGMTGAGGSNDIGVAFVYDISTSTYTKLSDFNGDNGGYPAFTSFVELPDINKIHISIADKSVYEGNHDIKFVPVEVTLSEKSEQFVFVHYTTQDNTAIAGSDYIAQSGKLVFPPGLKKIILPIRIKGDNIQEGDETFRIILSHPVNAAIANDTAIITIRDDDASVAKATQEGVNAKRSIQLLPNPAKDKVKLYLTGYSGNVVIQLSSMEGKILQQQKIQALPTKLMQQVDVSSYADGVYLVTVIDEKGNRQTEKLIVDK